MNVSIDDQVTHLMQGTEYGDPELGRSMARELGERLAEAAQERRPLRVYCGFDPRTSDLHLGHTVPMRKLRQFQELGHEVMFVVGTYTSLIGDPSDKDRLRPTMSPDEARRNARTYADQAMLVLDPERTVVLYNDEWLAGLSSADMIRLASQFTVQQFLSRDAFRSRWDRGEGVYLHETFYALFQAYDAWHLRADVQVGGSDQLFNIMTASRKLMSALGLRPNVGIIMGILPGTDGSAKMSKSWGNHIPILAGAEDMFGKLMSIPDHAMEAYFRMLSRFRPEQTDEILAGHPKDAKMRLAREIVEICHGPRQAQRAEDHFVNVFSAQGEPEQMPVYRVKPAQKLVEILHSAGLAATRSEARRLVSQGGVRLDGEVLVDPVGVVERGGVLRVGRRRFLRLEAGRE